MGHDEGNDERDKCLILFGILSNYVLYAEG